MTVEEIEAKKEKIKRNRLFILSCSPYKDFQFKQFTSEGRPLEGRRAVYDVIDGTETIVLFSFKNGLLNSDDDSRFPAIEYKNHLEYWKNGLLLKVVDYDKKTEELWEAGIPVSIETNKEE